LTKLFFGISNYRSAIAFSPLKSAKRNYKVQRHTRPPSLANNGTLNLQLSQVNIVRAVK